MIGETGLLPPDTLEQVRTRAVGGTFSQALIDEGFASALGVARTLAEQYHLPLVDLAVAGVDAEASKTIALPVLERVCAIPFASDGATLKLAITDPQNVRGLDELRLATRRPIEFYVAAKNDVLTELRRLSRAAEALNAAFVTDAAAEADEDADDDDLEADDGISDAPLVRLVNSIIFQAAEEGASDIHVEPQEHELVVRYRIDGVLHVAQRIPKRLTAGVTTRLKVLSKLDIAERRKPQDGRITLTAAAAGRLLDIRVATLPTVEGETVTMRLLDKSREVPTLESLGPLRGDARAGVRASSRGRRARCSSPARPAPASRRRSTRRSQRSAAPRSTSSPSRTRSSTGSAGSSRCRSTRAPGSRSRPRCARSSAPTPTSSWSARSATARRRGSRSRRRSPATSCSRRCTRTTRPSALTRLNEMGVEPFITGAAVSAVLAQRLARKLCVHCADRVRAEPRRAARAARRGGARGRARGLDLPPQGRLRPLRQHGLPRPDRRLPAPRDDCARSSSSPRRRRPREEIERAAQADGMRSLWHDGVGKVAPGITTVEELARVCTA